jgi:hypothetical protein
VVIWAGNMTDHQDQKHYGLDFKEWQILPWLGECLRHGGDKICV